MSRSPERPAMRVRACCAGLCVMAGLLAMGNAASADAIADFYRGRQMRLVVGAEAGSDYDGWARLLARHLGRFIPGRPSIIVNNMPGGGQIIATNHLLNIADRDGSIIGMVSRNLPYLILTGAPTLRGDAATLHWLGSPERASRICAASGTAAVKTADDLMTKQLLVGGTGAGAGTTAMPLLLSRLLDLKLKVIDGYRGAPAVLLAIERGELEGICFSLEALKASRPDWLRSGRLKVLFNLEREPLPGYHAPTAFRFATTERQQQILDVLNAGSDFGRPVVAPPGVPPERVATLRQALAAVVEDAEAKADAHKSGYETGLISGAQMTERLAALLRTPPEVVAETERLSR